MKGKVIERKNGDKFYIENIDSCICNGKTDESYVLSCRIKQLGTKEYSCGKNPDYIQKSRSEKKLWLSGNAKTSVNSAIESFEKEIAEAKAGSYAKAEITDNFSLYYKALAANIYKFIMEFTSQNNEHEIKIADKYSLREMLNELIFTIKNNSSDKHNDIINILEKTDEQTISNNPLYTSAASNNDLSTQMLLKLYYRIETEEERQELSSNVLVQVMLPRLSEKYNKDYYVKPNQTQIDMLESSDYEILHKPYFAMEGNTHSIWTLNPHTKKATDAAPLGSRAISYKKYFDLVNSAQ